MDLKIARPSFAIFLKRAAICRSRLVTTKTFWHPLNLVRTMCACLAQDLLVQHVNPMEPQGVSRI